MAPPSDSTLVPDPFFWDTVISGAKTMQTTPINTSSSRRQAAATGRLRDDVQTESHSTPPVISSEWIYSHPRPSFLVNQNFQDVSFRPRMSQNAVQGQQQPSLTSNKNVAPTGPTTSPPFSFRARSGYTSPGSDYEYDLDWVPESSPPATSGLRSGYVSPWGRGSPEHEYNLGGPLPALFPPTAKMYPLGYEPMKVAEPKYPHNHPPAPSQLPRRFPRSPINEGNRRHIQFNRIHEPPSIMRSNQNEESVASDANRRKDVTSLPSKAAFYDPYLGELKPLERPWSQAGGMWTRNHELAEENALASKNLADKQELEESKCYCTESEEPAEDFYSWDGRAWTRNRGSKFDKLAARSPLTLKNWTEEQDTKKSEPTMSESEALKYIFQSLREQAFTQRAASPDSDDSMPALIGHEEQTPAEKALPDPTASEDLEELMPAMIPVEPEEPSKKTSSDPAPHADLMPAPTWLERQFHSIASGYHIEPKPASPKPEDQPARVQSNRTIQEESTEFDEVNFADEESGGKRVSDDEDWLVV